MSDLKVGDRVLHEYLGKGKVSGFAPDDKDRILTFVMFDITPDYAYNMCENPTAELTVDLKRIDS